VWVHRVTAATCGVQQQVEGLRHAVLPGWLLAVNLAIYPTMDPDELLTTAGLTWLCAGSQGTLGRFMRWSTT
jgi:hypothetical protein